MKSASEVFRKRAPQERAHIFATQYCQGSPLNGVKSPGKFCELTRWRRLGGRVVDIWRQTLSDVEKEVVHVYFSGTPGRPYEAG